ncbi:putative bifunctional diguanylate cyclase/phosphodiesterase [Chengkuizengella axinellae]|uniref:Bifunctional diguanylate cyclase/phosphodiesterase n=1 Tax=Chengkuizengella axinellae TaxID=3064388 RepID=A0ABT9J123_9BACL|nr:bifunctional diguanylate cyclase/phosphodiesterase [Chengkuizengella sp. 2205SS18-9]MDP5275117.1 bifunctional diguanylate cyclase/phosphodiesterase [Chengkuizengella sp. 2205SS18-9]
MKKELESGIKTQRFLTILIYIVLVNIWTFMDGGFWVLFSFSMITLLVLLSFYIRDTKKINHMLELVIKSERKKTEDNIKQLLYYDDLTGLPNRRLFQKHLDEVIPHIKVKNTNLAVMTIDIDRFKLVNDSLGHDFGNILLMQIAERLNRSVTENDFVARIEGDKFSIYLIGLTTTEEIEAKAFSLIEAMEEVYNIQNHKIHISACAGISIYDDNANADLLIKQADIALYNVKEKGKNTFQIYTSLMCNTSLERFNLESDIRRAIENEEFVLYYQPQINTDTREIVGVEALIRWNDPIKGLTPPNHFIPIAEESGMIIDIENWVIRKACEQNKVWQNAGLPKIPISVNLSTRHFLQPDIVEMVAQVLKEVDLEPKYLDIEITESMTIDIDRAIITLQKLKELGVQISIDDFGTGYSSLNYLKSFPIHKLKIDRTFVRDIIKKDSNDAAIVSTIISMAHHLNLQVIAEGVESAEQLSYLNNKHCKVVQGFFFSPPVTAQQLHEKLLKNNFG